MCRCLVRRQGGRFPWWRCDTAATHDSPPSLAGLLCNFNKKVRFVVVSASNIRKQHLPRRQPSICHGVATRRDPDFGSSGHGTPPRTIPRTIPWSGRPLGISTSRGHWSYSAFKSVRNLLQTLQTTWASLRVRPARCRIAGAVYATNSASGKQSCSTFLGSPYSLGTPWGSPRDSLGTP